MVVIKVYTYLNKPEAALVWMAHHALKELNGKTFKEK